MAATALGRTGCRTGRTTPTTRRMYSWRGASRRHCRSARGRAVATYGSTTRCASRYAAASHRPNPHACAYCMAGARTHRAALRAPVPVGCGVQRIGIRPLAFPRLPGESSCESDHASARSILPSLSTPHSSPSTRVRTHTSRRTASIAPRSPTGRTPPTVSSTRRRRRPGSSSSSPCGRRYAESAARGSSEPVLRAAQSILHGRSARRCPRRLSTCTTASGRTRCGPSRRRDAAEIRMRFDLWT